MRTEQAYLEQARRFLLFVSPVSAVNLGEVQERRYLEFLALKRNLSAALQNQGFSALLYFFKWVLGRHFSGLKPTVRAHRGRRLPELLRREDVRRLLGFTEGISGLMLHLIYGAGLRLMECVWLLVKEVDVERGVLMVRDGQAGKDRVVMLPGAVKPLLASHFECLWVIWEADRAANVQGVWLPEALERKYPSAGQEWG